MNKTDNDFFKLKKKQIFFDFCICRFKNIIIFVTVIINMIS